MEKTPSHLKAAGAAFFESVRAEYGIHDSGGLALLSVAAEALDRMREAQAAIKKHGAMVADRYGQLKTNPACTLERDSRNGLLSALRQLHLDIEPLKAGPGRPTSPPGWTGN